MQVTAGSVMGRMGKQAERMAHELLEKRWVHFLATDAHNTSSRPPKMREAFDAGGGEVWAGVCASVVCVESAGGVSWEAFAPTAGAA